MRRDMHPTDYSRAATLRRDALARLCLLVLAAVTFAQAAAAPLAPGEGFVSVPGGPVWYRIYGSGTATPVVMVHGGPGGTSCAFDPLARLLSEHRPVIVYDQLGSGRSGRPMDTSLWNLERSVRELQAVRTALGLQQVHLMGSSWGSGLATDYVLTMHPSGVRSLILSGPFLSTKLWIEDANVLRTQLPADVQEVLTRNEQAGTVHSDEYVRATQVFYSHFLYHETRPATPVACAGAPSNEAIYEQMWGPTEFNATGSLLDFDLTPALSRLHLPVLLVVGRFDEARPQTAAKFQQMIPGARLEVLEHSGHLAPLEQYQTFAALLEDFFRQVESRRGR
jgi:proline iminopeptidase